LDNLLIALFPPTIWNSFRWPKFVQDDISDACDDKAAEVVEIVDIGCSDGDLAANCARETDNIDQNAKDVGNLGASISSIG